MLRSRPVLASALLAAALVACAKDEFQVPPAGGTGAGASQQNGGDPAAGGRSSAPPRILKDEFFSVQVLPGAAADAPPALELRAWTADGRPVPDLKYDVYWQTDAGPSISNSVLGPEGWTRNGLAPGALVHRVQIPPTGWTAPRAVPVNQYAQPGRLILVDAIIQPAGIVSGVVLDENGAPVPKAAVAGFQRALPMVDAEERPAADNAGIAEEDGTFRLGGFGPGPFVLEASSEQRVNVWRLTGVIEEGKEIAGVELVLEPCHGVHGQVLDPGGAPVRNARVIAGKPGRRELSRPGPVENIAYVPARQIVTSTDENGLFFLQTVPDSQEWNLNVSHPRFRKSVSTIAAGQVDVAVRLERGLEARGSVFDAAGERVAGAAVLLIGGAAPQAAQTNRHGVFVIGGLDDASGRYLYVRHPDHAPALIGPVTLDAGQDLEIRLAAPAELSGVLEDAGGAPLAGARVTLQLLDLPEGFPEAAYPADLRGLQSGLTAASGAFRFTGICAGAYRIEVQTADGRTRTTDGWRTGETGRTLRIE